MIIKSLHIENYQCYFDVCTFHFDEGLNIILGENNEGKTKLFESVDWLFNGKNNDLDHLISAKKLNHASIGDSFLVRVSMTIDKYGIEYKVSKSFTVRKTDNDNISVFNFRFEGEKNDAATGQREPIHGHEVLEYCFPFLIRKYSLFKGETELNIFNNEEALANLIDLFSEARHYDKYATKGSFLREKAENAVEQSTRLNQNNRRAYEALESEILLLFKDKERVIVHLNSTEDQIEKIEKLISEAERFVDNAEALQIVNKRIESIEGKISLINASIDENYTTSLFDDTWLLVHFERFHEEFVHKIAAHSKMRRELQTAFDKQKGIEEGERRAKSELLNMAIPLPIGVPSKAHMEEMLGDEICKVCNREAPKGSEPYQFMTKRLQAYLESQLLDAPSPIAELELFSFDYTNRLDKMAMSHEDNLKHLRAIRSTIQERFDFNDKRKSEIADLESMKEKAIQDRNRIFSSTDGAGEQELLDVFKNYKSWQDDLKSYTKDRTNYRADLQAISSKIKLKMQEKDTIDINNASFFLIKTRDILRDIEKIFVETKEDKFDEFIDRLELKSNKFFNKINIEAFTGQIKFTKTKNRNDRIKIDVTLIESGGRYFSPGTAVRTSMNISILLAISELANEVRSETYPLIFDAPTSSFGETKTGDFLNLIYETQNQKIILLKDFVGSTRNNDGTIKDLYIKKDFGQVKRNKAFWLKLDRPFDKNDLSTISTKVINL